MQPAAPRPLLCLPQLLRQHAGARPSSVALRFEGVDTTYAQLAVQAQQLVQHLQASGVHAGDRVAYLGFNHPLQMALLFAAAQVRAILVPLNFRLAPPEWDGVLGDCTPKHVYSDAHWAVQASALAARAGLAHTVMDSVPGLGQACALKPSAPAMPAPEACAHDPVLLVYTSGTTGLPKGALHTQGNLLANMALASTQMALTSFDTVVTVLPLFHVGGLCIQTLPALYVGARVILHARFDAGALLACIARERPTLTLLVPATMRVLLEHPDWPGADLRSLRAVWAGSSILPRHLVDAFAQRGVALCNVYGSTETGPFSIALGPAHAASHLGSCGWPATAPGLAVEVRLSPTGELCIRAPNVAQRYWPDQSAVDADGYFHTGDLAERAEDGSYTVVGRAKDMLISGGENIYPAEIENLLSGHPLVADCAVVGLPDAQWGEVVVACVVPQSTVSDTTALATQLADFLAPQIARYKQPRRWVVLAALPKTALGKVRKDQLVRSLVDPHSTNPA
jgi:fatty-acyl-CoA synthase